MAKKLSVFTKVWDAVDDFVLELGRVALIAALPVLYLSLEKGELNLAAVGMAAFIAVLRAVDRWLHEKGIAEKGIDRF